MGQGGQEEDRLAEADAAAGVRGSASASDGGAHLLLVGAEQEEEQGLREAVRKRGGVHLRRDDPFDGKAPSPWLRIFQTVSRDCLINQGRHQVGASRVGKREQRSPI